MAQSYIVFFFGAACIITALHRVSGESFCQTTCNRLHEYCDTHVNLCSDCGNVCEQNAGNLNDCTSSCSAWCKHVRKAEDKEYRIKYYHCFQVKDTIDIDDRPEVTDDVSGSGSGSGSGLGDSEGGDDRDDGKVPYNVKEWEGYDPPVPPYPTTTAPPQTTTTIKPVAIQSTPCAKSSMPELNSYIYGIFGVLVVILVVLNIIQCICLQRMIKKDSSKKADDPENAVTEESKPLKNTEQGAPDP